MYFTTLVLVFGSFCWPIIQWHKKMSSDSIMISTIESDRPITVQIAAKYRICDNYRQYALKNREAEAISVTCKLL